MGRPSTLPKVVAALRAIESTRTRTIGLSQLDLQRRAGVSASSVSVHIRELHAKRQVHIASWRTDATGHQARYRIGDAPDAPRPARMTQAEYSRRHRARLAKTGEIAEMRERDQLRKKRAYWSSKPARRDPLDAALFGQAVYCPHAVAVATTTNRKAA